MRERWITGGLLLFILATARWGAGQQVLFDFEDAFDTSQVECRDADARLVADMNGSTSLEVRTGTTQRWPGITLKPDQGVWDFSQARQVTLDVVNLGNRSLTLFCRIDTPDFDGERVYHQESITIEPGKSATWNVPLWRRMPAELKDQLFGMRGYPGGMLPDRGIDPARVDALLFFVTQPQSRHRFAIDNIRLVGNPSVEHVPRRDELFPMIDRFGQYMHKEWPGKIHTEEDLHRAAEAEAAELASLPGPDDWTRYGGWAAGPQLEATGHFHAAKHDGRWWLVDPEGRLFWSHGTTCVHTGNATTPITDREHYFAWLPEENTPGAEFYGRGSWAPHGYYHGKPSYRTFNFTASNLRRKYGDDWRAAHAELAHQRLRSWGMNTIANWSDANIHGMRRTPYTATIGTSGRRIEGSTGYWGKFPDPFAEEFRSNLRERMKSEIGRTADDSWCIGYFVDNELAWGDELSLATATLASPADQPAKAAFLGDLRAKYDTIERLNRVWETSHTSWDALLESTTPPAIAKARADLEAFATRVAEQYFRVCREEVKRAAPNTMYLGCRFAWVNDRAIRAAGKFCDVVSTNQYKYSVADFRLPEGVDRPVLIGEFHFGALDRGMFHTGLCAVADQEARAAAYESYVSGALTNPSIVGTHWFQFGEQATTGRGDEENYQIGLLDVCDTPYPETIRAVRAVGHSLYPTRSGSGTPGETVQSLSAPEL